MCALPFRRLAIPYFIVCHTPGQYFYTHLPLDLFVFFLLFFFQPFFLFLAKELHAENLFWFVRRNCLTKMQTTGQLIKNIEIFFNWIAIFVRPECTWQCCGGFGFISSFNWLGPHSAYFNRRSYRIDVQTERYTNTHTRALKYELTHTQIEYTEQTPWGLIFISNLIPCLCFFSCSFFRFVFLRNWFH